MESSQKAWPKGEENGLEGTIALMIPIIALLIPIVAILSAHQRKMAEIIHRNQGLPNGEIEGLRQEVRELRHLMHQQAIAIDDVRSRQTLGAPLPPTDVRERLAGS